MNEDKATRYHRRRRRAGLMAAGASTMTFAVLVLSGAVEAMAGLVERLVGVPASSPAAWPGIVTFLATTVAFTLAVAAPLVAIRFPLDVFREWTLDRVYGLERAPFGRWLGGYVHGLLVQGALVVAAAVVLRAATWTGPYWWLVGALALWVGSLAWTHAAPLLLAAFGSLRPLARPHVTERLRRLAERTGAALDVYEWRGGDDSRRAHAALGGVGRTRRVILSDTLLETLTVDEIEVVVAHELAHHVHGDVWLTSAWRLAVLAASLWAASLALDALPPVAPLDLRALAALPVIAGVAAVVAAVLSPVGHAISRARERRADAFAVTITGNPDAFLTSMRRLAASNLVDERPSRLARLLSSHPSIHERMTAVAAIRTRADLR
jgi:STE24 endopeptidase